MKNVSGKQKCPRCDAVMETIASPTIVGFRTLRDEVFECMCGHRMSKRLYERKARYIGEGDGIQLDRKMYTVSLDGDGVGKVTLKKRGESREITYNELASMVDAGKAKHLKYWEVRAFSGDDVFNVNSLNEAEEILKQRGLHWNKKSRSGKMIYFICNKLGRPIANYYPENNKLGLIV
jgi:hypothetical protein